MPFTAEHWDKLVQQALNGYAPDLLKLVTTRLLRPRTQLPEEELIERLLEALKNPPLLDRRIRDCSEAARLVLVLMNRSRRYRWKLGHLVLLLAALGHAEGYAPVLQLLEQGLLFPDPTLSMSSVSDFSAWIGGAGQLQARVFTPPHVAKRVHDEPLTLPTLPSEPFGESPRLADGWDWLLRLALVWQQVRATPMRLTQSLALFKRDQARLQNDTLLNAPSPQELLQAPDTGILTLFWGLEAELFNLAEGGELRAGPIADHWNASLPQVQTHLTAALFGVESWDPMRGYSLPAEGTVAAFPSVALLSLLLLTTPPPTEWVNPLDLAEWMWANHPAWSGQLSREEQKLRGQTWLTKWFLGVAFPLGLVEVVLHDGGKIRLSELGRFLFAGGPEPAGPPGFPQTLLVQPNAEVLAYRQGLTPLLIAQLTRFAKWKILGPACTLELTADHTYLGLEHGVPVAGMLQTLTRHSMKPVPPAVADLLQRWANKRERISIYVSATLVEFQTPADLDTALTRGIVSIKLTDRIGLTADGSDPEFKELRSIGNRDYEAKPQRCVNVAADGITLTVDSTQSDLLLEAEIIRVAELAPVEGSGPRRFVLTPASLGRAVASGWGLAELDQWFMQRSGGPLPPAARLFLLGPAQSPWTTARQLVLHLPSPELADGLMQWPRTRELIQERLGPTTLAIPEEHLATLEHSLAELGIGLEARDRDRSQS